MAKWFFYLAAVVLSSSCSAATLTVTGNPGLLLIDSAFIGLAPNTTSDSSTTYSLLDGDGSTQIIGSLNTALPAHTTLTIELAAPSGANSQGAIALSTMPQSLVTNISNGTYNNLSITYRFSATITAGVISPTSRTVTLSII